MSIPSIILMISAFLAVTLSSGAVAEDGGVNLLGSIPIQPTPSPSPAVEDTSQFGEFLYQGEEGTVGFVPFDISGNEPDTFLVAGNTSPFSSPGTNQLWIAGAKSWTNYVRCPAGSKLELIACAAMEGKGLFYQLLLPQGEGQLGNISFNTGYYRTVFTASERGRVVLLFDLEGTPSSAVIIDVIPPDGSQEATSPEVPDVTNLAPGRARVTIVSDQLKGFDIYVDGVYNRNDSGDGLSDGIAVIEISGDRVHTVTVSKRGGMGTQPFQRDFTQEFKSGKSYTINV